MATRAKDPAPARSTPTLLKDIAGDTGTLFRKELELFKQELMEGLAARLKAAAAIAVAGVLGLFVIGFAGMAAAAGLANVVAPWLAYLIVAGAFVLLAVFATMFAKLRMKVPSMKPEETIRTLKEDGEWARAQLKR
jgi:hypothetical protein